MIIAYHKANNIVKLVFSRVGNLIENVRRDLIDQNASAAERVTRSQLP